MDDQSPNARTLFGRGDGPGLPRIARFVLIFAALVILSSLLLKQDWVWDHVRRPYCEFLATSCGRIIGWTGTSVSVRSIVISAGESELRVVRGCDAAEPTAFLVIAMLAFPATLREKILGIGIGVPFILALNIVRIVLLTLLEIHSPSVFEVVHVYVFQVFIIAVAFGYFIWWLQNVDGQASALAFRS